MAAMVELKGSCDPKHWPEIDEMYGISDDVSAQKIGTDIWQVNWRAAWSADCRVLIAVCNYNYEATAAACNIRTFGSQRQEDGV
jgi:hypothetical protein